MGRSEYDAHEAMAAHAERRKRYAAGYPPMPPRPLGPTWAPVLTEQQKADQEQYIKKHNLPF